MDYSENQSGGQWRLFVSIPVPDQVRSALALAQQELRALIGPAEASWPKPTDLHLTLRFLANVSCERVPELQACLQSQVARRDRMELRCEGLGCFPAARHPKVIWAGVHEDGERLMALQRTVENATAAFAQQPPEGKFVGHVTVARLRWCSRKTAESIACSVARAAGRRFGSWTVGSVELVRSERSPAGSRYTTVAFIPLRP